MNGRLKACGILFFMLGRKGKRRARNMDIKKERLLMMVVYCSHRIHNKYNGIKMLSLCFPAIFQTKYLPAARNLEILTPETVEKTKDNKQRF